MNSSRVLVLPLLLTLASCTTSGEPTNDSSGSEEESGTTAGTDSTTDTEGATETGTETEGESQVGVSAIGLEHLGDDMVAPELSLEVDETGVVVTHTNHWDNCCYEPTASVELSGQTVNVSYENFGEDCDCVCSWNMGYRVEGLPPGTWTIAVAGLSAEATVE